MERIKHDKYKYKTVSLFAGIGGFDIAFSFSEAFEDVVIF